MTSSVVQKARNGDHSWGIYFQDTLKAVGAVGGLGTYGAAASNVGMIPAITTPLGAAGLAVTTVCGGLYGTSKLFGTQEGASALENCVVHQNDTIEALQMKMDELEEEHAELKQEKAKYENKVAVMSRAHKDELQRKENDLANTIKVYRNKEIAHMTELKRKGREIEKLKGDGRARDMALRQRNRILETQNKCNEIVRQARENRTEVNVLLQQRA